MDKITRVDWWAGLLAWLSLGAAIAFIAIGAFTIGGANKMPWMTIGWAAAGASGCVAHAVFWFAVRELLLRLLEIREALRNSINRTS